MVQLLLGGLLLGSHVRAAEFDEYAIKVAYLYNFTKYVEWPPGVFATANAPLLICIAGENPFGATLGMLAGKTVKDHPVEVRHVPVTTSLDRCHVVFIARVEQRRLGTILEGLDHRPILTVSDIANFTEMGGMIALIEIEQRIRFDINLAATRQAGLRLSSQLLKLARVVLNSVR